MILYDISLPITEDIPVWPGDPSVMINQLSAIVNGDSSNVSQIQMCVHTGTHIDAPKHFLDNGKTVEDLPLEKLIGETLVIVVDDDVKTISEEVLIHHPRNALINKAHKLLFKTKNSFYWHEHPNVFQDSYVGIDASGAAYLSHLDLDLIGVDYLSIASFDETTIPHQILLEKEIILLEGVDLSQVPEGVFNLFCLPLLLVGCEGAPARAILIK